MKQNKALTNAQPGPDVKNPNIYFDFVRRNKTHLADILYEYQLILNKVDENKVITRAEYTKMVDRQAADLLDLLLNKGEVTCKCFLSLLREDPRLKETFPRLSELDWTQLYQPKSQTTAGMVSASSLLSEEHFLCSICLEVFTDPVTLNCGHNFCKDCITQHWDSSDQCLCPVCKEHFYRKSQLKVNIFIAEMAAQYRKSVVDKQSSCLDQQCARPGEVPCDVCTGTKTKAVKSCLVCVASYCETHLEPHQRIPGLKRHELMDPVKKLEDKMCQRHYRPLEMFCKTDEVCLCQFCTETDHKLHQVVPLMEGYEGQKAQLGQAEAKVQQMIQERRVKIQQIQRSVKLNRDEADRQIADGMKVFTALMHSIERSKAELLSTIQDQQKSTERQAEGFIKELEQEIMVLTKRGSEMEKLSHTEDHLHLLQNFSSLKAPPHTKDWTKVNVHQPSYVGTVRRALDQLEETLNVEMKKLRDAELKKVQQEAVDVTLDPETAHPNLALSDDGKKVYHYGDIRKDLPDNTERFSVCPVVLGKQSFFSGRFYYEVEVKGKNKWDLGVVKEFINRKGNVTLTPKDGFWTLSLRNDKYIANAGPAVLLSVREKPKKVGVFVEYEEGLVSFYDVENRVHIYSFTGCNFIEPLYPYFSPCSNEGGLNFAPLIITLVKTD